MLGYLLTGITGQLYLQHAGQPRDDEGEFKFGNLNDAVLEEEGKYYQVIVRTAHNFLYKIQTTMLKINQQTFLK